MTLTSLFAWISTALLAAALVYAPVAYGCTIPQALPPLYTLLGASVVMGAIGFALKKHWPAIPRRVLFCVALLLFQGWWITWDPTFQPEDFIGDRSPIETYQKVCQLSLASMLATTFLLGAFVLLCALFTDARVGRFLLLVAACAGVLVSVCGIVMKLGGPPVTRYVWSPADIDWTNFAFFRYHGNAGAFLNLVWPLILVFTRRAYSPTISYIKKILWTFSALACGLALFMNASKASLIIGLLILPWPFSTWIMRLSRLTQVALVVGAILVVTGGVIISSRYGKEVAANRMFEAKGVSFSFDGRMAAYQEYLDALPHVGLFGIGPGLFQIAFPYQDSPLGNVREGLREYAHEDYLQTLIEWGWVGSIAWTILTAGGLLIAFRTYLHRELFTSRTDRHLVLAAILGVCGTLAQALIDFPLQIVSLRLFFLLLLAFCWASPKLLTPPPSLASYQRRSRS